MKKIVFLSVIVLALLIACKKEDTNTPIQSQTFEINSTGSTTWKYFSFAKNDTITVTDPSHFNDMGSGISALPDQNQWREIGQRLRKCSKFLSERTDRI